MLIKIIFLAALFIFSIRLIGSLVVTVKLEMLKDDNKIYTISSAVKQIFGRTADHLKHSCSVRLPSDPTMLQQHPVTNMEQSNPAA